MQTAAIIQRKSPHDRVPSFRGRGSRAAGAVLDVMIESTESPDFVVWPVSGIVLHFISHSILGGRRSDLLSPDWPKGRTYGMGL